MITQRTEKSLWLKKRSFFGLFFFPAQLQLFMFIVYIFCFVHVNDVRLHACWQLV